MCKIGLGAYFFAKTSIKQWFLMPRLEKPKENRCFWEALGLQKHGFVTDSDPHGSKSGSEGIPWQLFSSRISWEEPNPAIMSKMGRNI